MTIREYAKKRGFEVVGKLTRHPELEEAIIKYIATQPAAEFEASSIDYYLHILDNGEIVDDAAKADATFICRRSFDDFGLTSEEYEAAESPEAIYSHEVEGDPIFEDIVADLLKQANEYLENL